MKSDILQKIKLYRLVGILVIAYYLIYNTYFGWNKEPINDIEKGFDDVFSLMIALLIGLLIRINLTYIEFKMKMYLNNLNK